MSKNPDIYLLYEYMEKIPFTVRFKVQLDAPIDAKLLDQAAQEAIERFPYFKVQVGLDEGQNYTLKHNVRPISVLPEKDERLVLGSDAVNRHLFAITYRDDTVWFNFSHSVCGAFGGMFWLKATLYQYMLKKYGELAPPKDIKLPGSPIPEGESTFPDADALPDDEPVYRYDGGDSNLAILRFIKYIVNPFIKDCCYYQIEIPTKAFMDYAARVDGSPNTILAAMMVKMATRLLKEKKDTHLSVRIADDYRGDIGADESYRDFVRFIHIRYEWDMKDESIEKLNMRARGAIIKQNQAELSYERFKKLQKVHDAIDAQPDLKSKKRYASKNSTFRSDPRDNCTVSYVGKTDWGEMDKHIKGLYTITDGDLFCEVNALSDKFCITFQLIDKNRKPLDLFCEILYSEKIPYTVTGRFARSLPLIELPQP